MGRLIRVAAAALCAGLTVSACAQPAYTYVTDSTDRVYFKVPASWQRIDQEDLDKIATAGVDPDAAAAVRGQNWSIAFDAGSTPAVSHLFSPDIKAPIVYSRVLRLGSGARSGVTLDAVRDFFLPVNDEARIRAIADGRMLAAFELLEHEEVNQGPDLKGVHDVFQYKLKGVAHYFDQTAYVAKDASRIYLLLIRCSKTCYQDRHRELHSIVASFTVKSEP